jgi:flagellar hook-length control protein FliK
MQSNSDLSASSASRTLGTVAQDRRPSRASDQAPDRASKDERADSAHAAKLHRKSEVENKDRKSANGSRASTFDRALERSRTQADRSHAQSSKRSAHDEAPSNATEAPSAADRAAELVPELKPETAGASVAADGSPQDAPKPSSRTSLDELLVPGDAMARQGPADPSTTLFPQTVPLPLTDLTAALEADAKDALASDVSTSEALAKVSTKAKPTEILVPSATPPSVEKPEVELARKAAAPPAATARAQNTERAAEILRQVRVQLSPETRQAVIRLHPAELGRVSIHIEVRDRGVDAVVRAERPETLAALGHHLPELRAHLASSGLDVRDIQLSLGFDDRSNPKSGDGADRSAASAARREDGNEPSVHDTAALTRAIGAIGANGIDTYA